MKYLTRMMCILLSLALLAGCSSQGSVQQSENTQDSNTNEIASTWGPERATYTSASFADYATFNSATDNSEIGDERDFVRVREIGKDSYANRVKIVPGKEYEVCIYYNNNAGEDTNPTGFGVATNT